METILDLAKEHVLISKGKRYQLEIFIDVYKKEVRKHIAAELKKIGAEKLHIVEEDFYVYGFFTFKELIYYFNTMDVRDENKENFLIKRADSYTDFSCSSNTYLKLEVGMFDNLENLKIYTEVVELCPYCKEEVILENVLKIQVCPDCGKLIKTCSMCIEMPCGECPLDYK